jgi:arsenite methyltransferase
VSYGVDGPYFVVIGVAIAAGNLILAVTSRSPWPYLGTVAVLASLALGFNASRFGKFAVWAELLDCLALKGDVKLLDLGCGSAGVLLGKPREYRQLGSVREMSEKWW